MYTVYMHAVSRCALISILSIMATATVGASPLRSLDVFDAFFHDMHSMMRAEYESMAKMLERFDRVEKSMGDDAAKKGSRLLNKVSMGCEDAGCRIVVEGVESASINAEYHDDVFQARVDGLELTVAIRGNNIFVEAQEKASKEKEEEGSKSMHYARQSQSYMYPVKRALDIEALEPSYDGKKKTFELFIPYKKGRSVSVAIK